MIGLPLLQMGFAGFDKKADLDVMNHPILNAIYYTVGIKLSAGKAQSFAW